MTVTEARETIIRKYTNYRNSELRSIGFDAGFNRSDFEKYKESAEAITAFRTFSKGKALFAEQNKDEINKKRDEIYLDSNGTVPMIAAYQKALKLLWTEAEQSTWEIAAKDRSKIEDVSR
jgi:hypothetical protein